MVDAPPKESCAVEVFHTIGQRAEMEVVPKVEEPLGLGHPEIVKSPVLVTQGVTVPLPPSPGI